MSFLKTMNVVELNTLRDYDGSKQNKWAKIFNFVYSMQGAGFNDAFI